MIDWFASLDLGWQIVLGVIVYFTIGSMAVGVSCWMSEKSIDEAKEAQGIWVIIWPLIFLAIPFLASLAISEFTLYLLNLFSSSSPKLPDHSEKGKS